MTASKATPRSKSTNDNNRLVETKKLALTGDLAEADKILSGQDYYVQSRAFQYLLNFYRNTDPNSATAYDFCYALEQVYNGLIPGFPIERQNLKKGQAQHPVYSQFLVSPAGEVKPEEWKNIGEQLEKLASYGSDEPRSLRLNALHGLADHLKVDDDSRALMEFSYVAATSLVLVAFFQHVLKNDRERRGAGLARFLNQPERFREFGKALDVQNPLIRHGILIEDDGSDDGSMFFMPLVNPDMLDGIAQDGLNTQALLGRLSGDPLATDLEIEKDFTHLGKPLTEMLDYLEKALKDPARKGVNVVIYGPSGSGKTELAKAIAKHLDARLYAAGENLDKGDGDQEMTSRKRGRDLKSKDALFEGADKTILLFEEFEDMLIKGEDRTKSGDMDNKVELLRLLDNNKVVTIYTCNDIERFQDPVKSRFKYSLYLDYPPPLVRQNIWKRQCELKGFTLSDEDTLDLARKYGAPPRMIANAVEIAKTRGGSRNAVEQALRASAKLVYGMSEAIEIDERVPTGFSPSAVNLCEGGKEKVEDIIARGQRGHAFSLFVGGAKGAGVGSLMRYVGENLAMNVMETSMAALAQAGQMPPELNIQRAFLQAEDNNQFLVISDIEHLLANPKGDNWNESLAGAFLKAARVHKLPFAITSQTKSFSDLPESIRFMMTDDLRLSALDEKLSQDAYRRFFGRSAPQSLAACKNLLLSDFSEVSKVAARYGADGLDDDALVGLLKRRIEGRGQNASGMGFGTLRKA